MRFLWKSQLKRERGRLIPHVSASKNSASRKERLSSHVGRDHSYGGIIFLWSLFLGTLLYVAFFSPYLMITETKISGVPMTDDESLAAFVQDGMKGKYLFLFPKNDFFLVFPRKLETRIKEEFPLVRDVRVARIFPDTLVVRIEPRESIVLWCSGGTCSQILENGNTVPRSAVFEKETNMARTVTIHDLSEKILPIEENVFSPNMVSLVTSIKETLHSRFGIEIKDTFTTASRFANELRVTTEEGWEIYINTERPLETTVNDLALILDKEILPEKRPLLRYLDLRTESRVYYVFKDEAIDGDQFAASAEAVDQKPQKKDAKK